MSNTRGAVVEIIDPTGNAAGPLLPRRVRINGVDVGYIAKDSLRIKTGNASDVTEVTLTLMPSRVVIRNGDDEATEHHCTSCECIHDCGYVIGSAGCVDFHDNKGPKR